jgi:hypothetical protein
LAQFAHPPQKSLVPLSSHCGALHVIALVMLSETYSNYEKQNVSYEPRVITVRSNNGSHNPKAITFPHSVEALCANAKI